jgi:hypothetical protein
MFVDTPDGASKHHTCDVVCASTQMVWRKTGTATTEFVDLLIC